MLDHRTPTSLRLGKKRQTLCHFQLSSLVKKIGKSKKQQHTSLANEQVMHMEDSHYLSGGEEEYLWAVEVTFSLV